MRLQDLFESKIVEFPISNVKRKNGAIGTQGVTTGQVAGVLRSICKLDVTDDMSMRELVDAFKGSSKAQEALHAFMKQHPVKVTQLPDETYHLEDGHHRTFLMDQAGYKTIPAELS